MKTAVNQVLYEMRLFFSLQRENAAASHCSPQPVFSVFVFLQLLMHSILMCNELGNIAFINL